MLFTSPSIVIAVSLAFVMTMEPVPPSCFTPLPKIVSASVSLIKTPPVAPFAAVRLVIVVFISAVPAAPIPVFAVNVTVVDAPKMLDVSAVKLSLIAPLVAVTFTIVMEFKMLSFALLPAVNVIVPVVKIVFVSAISMLSPAVSVITLPVLEVISKFCRIFPAVDLNDNALEPVVETVLLSVKSL